MTWEEIYAKTMEYLKSNRSKNTVSSYESAFKSFGFTEKPSLDSLVKATTRFHEDGMTNKSILLKYSALRFVLTNFEDEFDSKEAKKMLRYMKETKMDSRVAPVAEVKEVEYLMDRADSRTAMCIGLMYYTGLRVGEVAALNLEDFERKGDRVYMIVRDPKNKKDRRLVIPSFLSEIIDKYLKDKPSIEAEALEIDKRALVVGRFGRMTDRSISRLIREACDSAGFTKLTCHSFRHACATEMSRNGVPLRIIQEQLGHSDINITQRYIGVSMDDLEEAVNKINRRK